MASASASQEVAPIANQTLFYGESGGQSGDCGVILTAHDAKIEGTETAKKLCGMHVHLGKVFSGTVSANDAAEFTVANTRRSALRANHSATHLLHAALRWKLGRHVT